MAEKVKCRKFATIDPGVYISESFFDQPGFRKVRHHILRCYHKFFTRLETTTDLKILDIGSGPTIAFQISAAQHSCEITLSDISDSFRSAVQKWVDGDPSAQDWMTYFKYVVMELEGKGEKEAKERETQLRKVIKAVVACDITKDPPLPAECMQRYDIVTSTLCLEHACESSDAYRAAIERIYNLLKPGGRIAILDPEIDEKLVHCHHHDDEETDVKHEKQGFKVLSITEKSVKKIIEESGFLDVQVTVTTKDELNITDKMPSHRAYIFVTGVKK